MPAAENGESVQLQIPAVSLAGATAARLALSAQYPWFEWNGVNHPPTFFNLRYRLNGGAWHDRFVNDIEANAFQTSRATAARLGAGLLSQIIELDVAELREGDNTLELAGANVWTGLLPDRRRRDRPDRHGLIRCGGRPERHVGCFGARSMRPCGLMLMLATALHAGCTYTYRRPRPATAEQLQAQVAQDATRDAGRTDGDPVTMLPALSSAARRPPPTGMPPHVNPTLALSIRAATAPVSVVDVVSPVGSMPPRGYEVKRRMPGAMDGLTWGLLGGAATGAAIGYIDGDNPPGVVSFSAGGKAAMGRACRRRLRRRARRAVRRHRRSHQ